MGLVQSGLLSRPCKLATFTSLTLQVTLLTYRQPISTVAIHLPIRTRDSPSASTIALTASPQVGVLHCSPPTAYLYQAEFISQPQALQVFQLGITPSAQVTALYLPASNTPPPSQLSVPFMKRRRPVLGPCPTMHAGQQHYVSLFQGCLLTLFIWCQECCLFIT